MPTESVEATRPMRTTRKPKLTELESPTAGARERHLRSEVLGPGWGPRVPAILTGCSDQRVVDIDTDPQDLARAEVHVEARVDGGPCHAPTDEEGGEEGARMR